ncbi:ABC transporter ATP-binding protein [Tsukamurella sp. 1534]|uniref:ABC transporter ATP-binding protein n=1 Tax=Tsukamurella sp. 1534 TaxID=1151061 RepID=UPI0003180201|nr:ABC transporter ATP-binding protein [Tsukamurella sp. 1534]
MRKSLSVSARGLRKSFGRAVALGGLDLDVREGEVHGFLGPNGAGKSTTIRALLGQLTLDGGEARVFGLDPRAAASEVHDRLAYVPGDVSLWPGLSGGECIDILGGLQGHLDERRRDELIERFELDPTKRARTYSKGNRQKVALVAALACDADLYVLDEPTSGLDPLMEARFQAAVRERNDEGRTVLLSSHILDEVDALCDRVTIVRAGATVSTGTLSELRAGTRTTIEAVTPATPSGLAGLAGVADLDSTVTPGGVRTTLTASHDGLAKAVATVAASDPTELSVHPPSLEQLFLTHYGEER